MMIAQDKANHWIVGALIAAIGWEVYQRVKQEGTPSVLDVVYTLAGGAVELMPLAVWRITQ